LLSAAAVEMNTRRLSALNNLCSRDISRITPSQKPTGRRTPTHTDAVATAIAAVVVAAAVVAAAEVATAVAAAAAVAWQLQSSAPPRSSLLPTAGHSHKSHTTHTSHVT
jgi:hypothetical protein